MNILYAFISAFFCSFCFVSGQIVDCPEQGKALGCVCKLTLNNLGVTCKNVEQIKDIPSWIPENTTLLELEECDITVLNKDSFRKLRKLTDITISKQKNRVVLHDSLVFQDLESLDEVILDENDIQSLPEGLFANISSLRLVSLNNNPLRSLPDDLLANSINIETLRLAHTSLVKGVIVKIGEGHFGMNIESLLLSGTYVQTLGDHFFRGLPKLRFLVLGDCGIEFIGSEILSGTMVTNIILDDNPLKIINENAFLNSQVSSFECESCNLTSNVTFNGFFKKIPRLTRILLQNNRLTTVPKNAFTGLSSLSLIDLSDNMIGTLDRNAGLPKCETLTCIQLRNNPLNCDCDLAWLRLFADSMNGAKPPWKCAQPQKVAGKSLLSLQVSEFCCTTSNSTQCGLHTLTSDPNNGLVISLHVTIAILSQVLVMVAIPLLLA